MNEQEPDAGRGIDPQDDARIRALLGEVGAEEEPIPADVSARLEDTLAMLRAERVEAGADAEEAPNVVPLRRRWLPRAAGAAAAVIVLGVGGIAAVRLGTNDPSSQDSAASGGVSSDTAPSSPPATAAPEPSAASGSKSRALRESSEAVRALPAVTSAAFAGDVAGLLRSSRLVTPARGAADQSGAPLTQQCPGPAVTDGAVANPVRVDGSLAVVLVHPPEDGKQLVEAWTCAGDRRLDSTQLTGADVTP